MEALREATSAGLDVQLKILQALPSLLQNYSKEIQGDLLVTALNICFILQTTKNGIVNNTAAATLQQLVMTVFEKVTIEDSKFDVFDLIAEADLIQNQYPMEVLLAMLLLAMAMFSFGPRLWMPTAFFGTYA